MIRKEFEMNMENRFECDKSVIQKWIEFAEENVKSERYVKFTPEPDEQAVGRWLDSIFSSLYFVQKRVGMQVVNDILNLTEKHCLYPYEMMGLIEHLESGGDTNNLIEKSLNGFLDGTLDGKIMFPMLEDVKRDLEEKKKENRTER